MDDINYEDYIRALKQEIVYLRKLLDQANIQYQKGTEYCTDIQKNSSNDLETGPIIYEQLTPQHASLFYSIFKGRRDVYAKRSGKPNSKTGKTGYFTQCLNFWKDGICARKKGESISCNECVNQKYKELRGRVLLEHLHGAKDDCTDVVGLYAIFPNETCNFLIFDFDNHDPINTDDNDVTIYDDYKSEVEAIRNICKLNNVPIVVERSRSGNGAHVWIFFKEPISAELARKFGSSLLTKGAESVNLKNFKFYDRMIPTQDHLPINKKTGKQGLGNLVALPL